MDTNIKYIFYYVLIKLSYGFCYQSSYIYNGKLNNQSRQSHNIMYNDNSGTLSKQSLSNMGAMVVVTLDLSLRATEVKH